METMRLLLEFKNAEGWRYQVMHLESQGRVQIWYKQPGYGWELGHGRDVPMGGKPIDVAKAMQRFVFGELNHNEYQDLLPV